MIQIGVLGSTNGSDLPAIVGSINKGKLKGLARIAVVLSDKEEAGILKKAESYGLSNFYFSKKGLSRQDYDKRLSKVLDIYQTNLIALIGYMNILSEDFVDAHANKIMNVHPSLLPSFPGIERQVYRQILDSGCKVSGCTLFFVDKGKDTGPIIMQKSVPVYSDDDVHKLKERTQWAEQRIYPEAIRLFALGKIKVEGRKVIINDNQP